MTASLSGGGNDAEENEQKVYIGEKGKNSWHTEQGKYPRYLHGPFVLLLQTYGTCPLPMKAFSDHPLAVATLNPISGNLHLFFSSLFLYSRYHFLVPNTLFILSFTRLLSLENKLYKTRDHQYLEQHLIGWYKGNCGFCIVEICHLILEYFLYKFGLIYIILMCISHFMFFFLMTYYLLFILYLF